eukprot:TRINITY_DN29743_c0_g1_i1.p1 TRINITY_DN29743_c0_g1~~TRINITY_DN29743_c0_g1_i1.p1  ORF type:complete len:720 (+),score=105.16 TRINITY_DN29743_c0_g1_i1:206-2161(+)
MQSGQANLLEISGAPEADESNMSRTSMPLQERAVEAASTAGAASGEQVEFWDIPPKVADCVSHYKLEREGIKFFSGLGVLYKFYHLVVEFGAPIFYALRNQTCKKGILYVPNWYSPCKFCLGNMTQQFESMFSPWLELKHILKSTDYGKIDAQPINWNMKGQGEEWGEWGQLPKPVFRSFRQYMWGRAEVSGSGDGNPRQALLVRRLGGVRALPSEMVDDMLGSLRASGVRVLVESLEGVNMLDQVRLFFNASAVIASHGAAISNMLFMRSTYLLVELWIRQTPCYQNIARILQLPYVFQPVASWTDGLTKVVGDFVFGRVDRDCPKDCKRCECMHLRSSHVAFSGEPTDCADYYRLPADAGLSPRGQLNKLYNLLVDFAPSVVYKFRNLKCKTAVLYVPDYKRGPPPCTFCLTGGDAGQRPLDYFDFIFSPWLELKALRQFTQWHHTTAQDMTWHLGDHVPKKSSWMWSRQPAEVLLFFRGYMWSRAKVEAERPNSLLLMEDRSQGGKMGRDRQQMYDRIARTLPRSPVRVVRMAVSALKQRAVADTVRLFHGMLAVISMFGEALNNMLFLQDGSLTVQLGEQKLDPKAKTPDLRYLNLAQSMRLPFVNDKYYSWRPGLVKMIENISQQLPARTCPYKCFCANLDRTHTS